MADQACVVAARDDVRRPRGSSLGSCFRPSGSAKSRAPSREAVVPQRASLRNECLALGQLVAVRGAKLAPRRRARWRRICLKLDEAGGYETAMVRLVGDESRPPGPTERAKRTYVPRRRSLKVLTLPQAV